MSPVKSFHHFSVMIIATDDVNEKLVQVVCQPEYEPRRLDLLLRLPRPRLFAINLQSGSVHFSTIIGSQLLLLSATYSVLVLTTSSHDFLETRSPEEDSIQTPDENNY